MEAAWMKPGCTMDNAWSKADQCGWQYMVWSCFRLSSLIHALHWWEEQFGISMDHTNQAGTGLPRLELCWNQPEIGFFTRFFDFCPIQCTINLVFDYLIVQFIYEYDRVKGVLYIVAGQRGLGIGYVLKENRYVSYINKESAVEWNIHR